MTKDIFVFVEQREGAVLPAGLQAISAAVQLAAKTGGKVVAGLIGSSLGPVASKLDASGAVAVLLCDSPALAQYQPLKYTRALGALVQKADPQVVLMAASFMGRDLAPRL